MYADQVAQALQARGWPQLMATESVDRQSGQTFERWATALGAAINKPLDLHYTPLRPATRTLVLFEREDFGAEVNAPTSILRFRSGTPGRSLPAFVAGDLVGILPPADDIPSNVTSNSASDTNSAVAIDSTRPVTRHVPRFYSLASASRDGVLEICVRRLEHGVCSRFLCDLKIGESAEGFIQKNPHFQPHRGKSPVILIGAGTGIGPLVGFIRGNRSHRPMNLYWGGRLAESDFLYQDTLHACLADARLTRLQVAFSRSPTPKYVQDVLRDYSAQVRDLIARDAQILVCGGRRMAADVAIAMEAILAPMDLSVAALKQAGRYLEDTY